VIVSWFGGVGQRAAVLISRLGCATGWKIEFPPKSNSFVSKWAESLGQRIFIKPHLFAGVKMFP